MNTIRYDAGGGLRRSHRLLVQAEQLLSDGYEAATPDERFQCAHLAALRIGAAVLAALSTGGSGRRRGPLSVWRQLAAMDGELAHWSEYFAAGARIRARIDLGVPGVVDAQQAQQWLQSAEEFYGFARERLDSGTGSSTWTGREAS